MKKSGFIALLLALASVARGQQLTFDKKTFALKNVTGAVVTLDGEKVLKLERDLQALPFDANRLGSTVDEPTYARLADLDFTDGTIEVKVRSQLQQPVSFPGAQGFIGLAFRIDGQDAAYESVYLRPKVGRSDNQYLRNHTVQYYAYPDYKFDRLRKEAEGTYETTAPVALDEWITLRLEVSSKKVYLFVNNAKYSTFVVDGLKGKTTHGAVALWVDIGTVGYFKDLKIVRR